MRRVPPLDLTPGGDGQSLRFAVWNKGKRVVQWDDPSVANLLVHADIVLDSWSKESERHPLAKDHKVAPEAVWVVITPFGDCGPRRGWRGSDLTCMAASGNLYATGDPDRAPLPCGEPLSYVHAAAEAVVGALTAHVANTPQRVSVSMQEAAVLVGLYAPTDVDHHGDRGQRHGSIIGNVPEVWKCRDGFVAYGLRGGKAHEASWAAFAEILESDGLDAAAVRKQDWVNYDFHRADAAVIDDVAPLLAEYFNRHTMDELNSVATDRNIMMAPVVSPSEIFTDEQLLSRGFISAASGRPAIRGSFVQATRPTGGSGGDRDAPAGLDMTQGDPLRSSASSFDGQHSGRPWDGLRILELGSGIAGPLCSRFFVEHGATCIRVESRVRPDVMRVAGTHRVDPFAPPMEGSAFFANLNAGKQSISLNLDTAKGKALLRRLMDWADVVVENFRPGVLEHWGLGYEEISSSNPGLVLLSSCMWGSYGPRSRYPGYGSQGAAFSGYTYLTGWPDRAPCGIYPGAVTDSLGPVYGAAAVAAALIGRQRTGVGAHLDLSQVEVALFTLSPWLTNYVVNGEKLSRHGSRSSRGAVPHGVFPCRGDDRWIALVVWSEEDWISLCDLVPGPLEREWDADERADRIDLIEKLVSRWTRGQDAHKLAEFLQERGVEAYPVLDFFEVHDDPQIIDRGHYVAVEHPILGTRFCDRSAFRLERSVGKTFSPGPLFGQHTKEIAAKHPRAERGRHTRVRKEGDPVLRRFWLSTSRVARGAHQCYILNERQVSNPWRFNCRRGRDSHHQIGGYYDGATI